MNTYGDQVTVLAAPLITGYGGKQVRDWANATQTTIAAAVQPQHSAEDITQTQSTVTGARMHCAPGSVRAVDRVLWRGLPYWVNGEPELHSMFGRPDHLEVELKLVLEAAT